jgi:hypothetical protein
MSPIFANIPLFFDESVGSSLLLESYLCIFLNRILPNFVAKYKLIEDNTSIAIKLADLNKNIKVCKNLVKNPYNVFAAFIIHVVMMLQKVIIKKINGYKSEERLPNLVFAYSQLL